MHAGLYFSRDRSRVYQLEFLIANNGHQLHSLRWKNILFQGLRLRVQAWTFVHTTSQGSKAVPAVALERPPPCPWQLTAVLLHLPLCRSPRALLSLSRIRALAKGVWGVPARSASSLEEGISLREGEGLVSCWTQLCLQVERWVEGQPEQHYLLLYLSSDS